MWLGEEASGNESFFCFLGSLFLYLVGGFSVLLVVFWFSLVTYGCICDGTL